jgi:hypothetical protein
MISYLLGVGDNYSGVVPVLIYAVYSKSFCCFLKKKLKEDGEAPPESQGPVIGLSAIASGAAPAPAAPAVRRSRWSPPQPSTLTTSQQAAIEAAKVESRRRASSPNPRLGSRGGYRMTSKPHNRKTGKHKKSRKQKSKRLTRRRRKADK